jgi:hypothetical protein
MSKVSVFANTRKSLNETLDDIRDLSTNNVSASPVQDFNVAGGKFNSVDYKNDKDAQPNLFLANLEVPFTKDMQRVLSVRDRHVAYDEKGTVQVFSNFSSAQMVLGYEVMKHVSKPRDMYGCDCC